jgi:two-component system, OmpR family, response regulator
VRRDLARLEFGHIMSSTDAPINVLLVEDDERLAKLTALYLEGTGFIVTCLTTGLRAQEHVRAQTCDVVLLDLMMPGRDGIDVCRELRDHFDVPIIMVTARREEADRVLGFDAGADDYVTKPFSARELGSRIRAIVRRARGGMGPIAKVLRVGSLMLDPSSLRVTVGAREVHLTSYEFALLKVLAERAGRVLSREQLLDLVHGGGADDAFDRSIDVHVSKLRQKLGDDARQPVFLKTVRGAGYMLARDDG